MKIQNDPITSLNVEYRNDNFNRRNDKDIFKSFHISSSPDCHYVPSGLGDHFKNLKVLVIAYTGLKALTQSDLRPLKKLQNLNFDNNQLEFLEDDLFIYNPIIESINMSGNRIKYIGLDVFAPLKSIDHLNFEKNVCINDSADGKTEIEELKMKMNQKCHPVVEDYTWASISDHVEIA